MSTTQSEKAPPPSGEPSMIGRVIRSTIGGAIAEIVGVATVIVVGMFVWDAVVGVRGPIIAGIVGALLSGLLRGLGDWSARCFAGVVGEVVGGFFAVAAAEQSAPGSTDWAVRGGLIGAALAVPFAVVAAGAAGFVLALVRPRA